MRGVIQKQANSGAVHINKIVPPQFHRHAIDVVIQYLPAEVLPEFGIGGSCFPRGLATITVDPGVV